MDHAAREEGLAEDGTEHSAGRGRGVPVAQLACRADGRVVWCNRAAERLLGLRRGDPLVQAVDEADRAALVWPPEPPHARLAPAPRTVRTVGGRVVEVHVRFDGDVAAVAVVDVSSWHAAVVASTVDPLTGLPTRREVVRVALEHRREALATGTRPALALIDLDRMREVNDQHGHAAGDAVLTDVAGRLAGAVGADGVVGRVGGDEFLVCVRDGGVERARALVERLRVALVEPVELDGRGLLVTLSAGIAVHSPTIDFDQCLREADAALHRAKRAGRGRTVVYSPTEGERVDVRRLEQQVARLQRRAEHDDRTGLLRDLVFREDHLRLLREAHEEGTPLSLVLVDLDQFHEYNVQHGLQQGNAALRSVADRCREAVEDRGRVYRYGGDELAVLLPGTRQDGALALADRVRAAVEADGLEHRGSSRGVVTVSVGVCTWAEGLDGDEGAPDGDRLVARAASMVHGANRALLDVKDAGRNGCRSAPPQAGPVDGPGDRSARR